MAAREGLEPPTLALGKPCSIRLSYRARVRCPDCHGAVSYTHLTLPTILRV